MGFERFGARTFVSETKAEEFVQLLERGIVATVKCRQCGHTAFPPRMDCPKCRSGEVAWVEIKEAGELAAFTRVMYGPAGFEDKVPYTLGVLKLANGTRIFGGLDPRIPFERIRIGMRLRPIPLKLPGDRFAFQFQE